MKQPEFMSKSKKKVERRTRLRSEERLVDLMERVGASFLYISTPLGQNEVARVLGMDNNRVNEMLKGIKKTK